MITPTPLKNRCSFAAVDVAVVSVNLVAVDVAVDVVAVDVVAAAVFVGVFLLLLFCYGVVDRGYSVKCTAAFIIHFITHIICINL